MTVGVQSARELKWNRRLQRFTFFLGIVLLHEILFLSLAHVVIWSTPRPDYLYHRAIFMRVPSPPAPKAPLPSAITAAVPLFHPPQPGVPVVTRPILTTFHTYNVAVDMRGDVDQILNHLPAPGLQAKQPAAAEKENDSGDNGKEGYGQLGQGTGFVGVLYDLKQTPYGLATDIAENAVELSTEDDCDPDWLDSEPTKNGLDVLRSFVQTWDTKILDKYYQAPKNVYATQICVPYTTSKNGPAAFQMQDTVHPRRWNVVYRARIVPPETGEFRFIGFSDDFLMVRIDSQNVLDANWPGEEIDLVADVDEDVGLGPEGVPLKCGKWIQMEAGVPMNMQVLIGEGPGGFSGFLLMIQKQGDNSPKGDYPVFQLKESPIPDLDPNFHFSKKRMVFGVAN